MAENPDDVFKDFNTPGNSGSGEYKPEKARIRKLLKELSGNVAAVGDFRGSWSNATAYIATDLVESGGSIWYAKLPNTNVTPTAGATWALFLPGVSVADGTVTEAKVTPTATDALRITISQLSYPRLADRTGDPSAAAANRAAIQTALNSKKYVELGEGDIRTDTKIVLNPYNFLMGEGGPGNAATKLTIHSTTAPCIELSALSPGMYIESLQVLRVGTPGAAAHGISCAGYVDECHFAHLRIEGHRIGVYAQGTNYSTMNDLLINANTADGLRIENSALSPASQWYIDDILSQSNGGHGLVAQSFVRGSQPSMLVGNWNNVRTFGNDGSGMAVLGNSSVPILAMRIRDGFLGGDGGLGELYLDSYGRDHTISNLFCEFNRSGATGPAGGTPINPSNGAGVFVSPNNVDATFNGCIFYGNKGDGADTYASEVTVFIGCEAKYNTGYGLWFAEGNKALVMGSISRGNSSADIFAATDTPEVIGSWPRANGSRFMSGVAFGAPTGGIPAAGSVNVSGDVAKNNTNYNNP